MSVYDSFFIAQHVSNIITFILKELTTVCGCIALFGCVLVYWCVSAGVGWYPNAGWSTVEQYTHIQSSAPEDECNNIRNMLSNKKLS